MSERTSRRNFIRGAAGAVALGAGAGTAAAQEGTGTSSGGSGGGTATVAVGPNGDFVFKPGTDKPLYITPGTTVKFVWESDNHNVVVESQPSGANWEGTPGGESKTYNTGYTYTHTFDTLGTYQYYCSPHRAQGMTGTIEVVESTPTPTPVPQGPPEVPDSAKSLGIASFIAMCATLGLAFIFTKYGGDYEPPEE
ncbi:plastocyanin/azurin family copper-binding protein [Halobaculum sp. D14]|uniref:plastocyanin/azurin family copper-binding protein n=1 Tax=unclassified Halobaculum TaxID=2640896 RepID=UPI003EBEADAE